MGYRFPIVEGDRVALAPHTDLWMRGIRFGIVTSLNRAGRFYFVDLPNGKNVTLDEEDLLGAVNAVPGDPGGTSAQAFGATSSTGGKADPWDGKRDLNGDTYAEHMRKFNARQAEREADQ